MDRPLRILGIGNTYPPEISGGYAEISADVMEGLAERGHDVRMLVSQRPDLEDSRGPDMPQRVKVKRELGYVLACWRRPLRGLRATKADQKVMEAAITEGVDVAIVWHMRGTMKPPLRLLHDAGIPVLYILQDRWVIYERAGPWLKPWSIIDRLGFAALRELFGRLARPLVELRAPPIEREGWNFFASSWLEEEYARLGYHPARAGYLPCGIDLSRFDKHQFEPHNGTPKRLLFAGRIHPWKGLQVAIEAMAKARSQFELRIAGPNQDPAYGQRMAGLIESRGLADRIEWLGELSSREAVFEEIASADIVLYPSLTVEAYALGLLEAMAARRLIATSAPGGPRDYLENGVNALVFDPGDVDALAAALDRLHDEPDLRVQLVEGAQATAEAHSLVRILDEVEEKIRIALDAAAGRG